MEKEKNIIIIDLDNTGTSPFGFFATDVAEQWFLPMEEETDEMIKAPSAEAWLFQNPKALATVRRGLKDAAEGRVRKVNLNKL